FVCAFFLARPCPFYLLDEVEAALDDTNIGRFVELLRRYSDRAQFVVITHQKRTMEAADVLYGVTMGGEGVSQVVSRRLPREEAKLAGSASAAVVLYDRAAFEPLTDKPWDEARAREGIAAIVADADVTFHPDELWPAHEWDGWQAALPLKNLYVGAAGVIWALDDLRRRGFAETRLDLSAAVLRALALWRAEPDYVAGDGVPEPPESGLLTGEARSLR